MSERDRAGAGAPNWKGKAFSFFSHRQCEYFFCYCPLYALGPDCGGNFRYTEKGIKDCSRCTLPHQRDNYGYVTAKFQEIARRMAEERERNR